MLSVVLVADFLSCFENGNNPSCVSSFRFLPLTFLSYCRNAIDGVPQARKSLWLSKYFFIGIEIFFYRHRKIFL